jgi:hypothetical protein
MQPCVQRQPSAHELVHRLVVGEVLITRLFHHLFFKKKCSLAY